jgi:hypothetical protein
VSSLSLAGAAFAIPRLSARHVIKIPRFDFSFEAYLGEIGLRAQCMV